MDENKISEVVRIIKKYCLPKKEFDDIEPRQVAVEIIEAVEGKKEDAGA